MSVHVSKTLVGGFVLGGVALFLVALGLLGSNKFFADEIDYVLYFDGSVSGLSIGAPVVFRGVPLGNVVRINLVANARDEGVTIPVYIRIDENNIIRIGKKDPISDAAREEIIRRMVERGLRARLQLQSLITGQYRIELDFFPDTAARYHSSDHEFEIPTLPSPLDEFQRTLARLPLDDMVQTFQAVLTNVARITANDDIPGALAAMRGAFENAQNLLADIAPLRDELRHMLRSLDQTATTIDQQLPEAMAAFQLAMNSFAAAAQRIERTVAEADNLVARDSRTVREFNQALKEFSDAARAVRSLASMLERQPEALLRGKGGNR